MDPVRRVGCGTLMVGCLGTGLWATQALARDIPNDGQHSVAKFQLDLPLGRELDGQFPLMKTEWLPQADGRWRVAVSLPTEDVKIPGRPQYTRIMRGKMFFDSLHHPRIHFLSDAFDAPLLTTGGAMSGGNWYRVGEHGPEDILMPQNGFAVPLGALSSGGSGQPQMTGGNTYQFSGNLMTPEFWRQIQGEIAAGEARAYGRAMNDAPKLTMSQTARQQRQAVGRQRRGS